MYIYCTDIYSTSALNCVFLVLPLYLSVSILDFSTLEGDIFLLHYIYLTAVVTDYFGETYCLIILYDMMHCYTLNCPMK